MAGLTVLATHAWVSLVAADPSPLPDEPPIDPSRVTPGLLGLVAFLFLIVAVAFLYRSLRKQLKRVDDDLPDAGTPRRLGFDDPSDSHGKPTSP